MDAEVSLSDSGCSRLFIRQSTHDSIRQRMQDLSTRQQMQEYPYQALDAVLSLYQTEDTGVSIRQRMQCILYQREDAGVSLSGIGCRTLSVRQWMQESLYQTATAGDTLSDSRCRILYIRQWMQDSLLIWQQMQESLLVNQAAGLRKQITNAGFSLLNSLFTLKYNELTCILYLEFGIIHWGSRTWL